MAGALSPVHVFGAIVRDPRPFLMTVFDADSIKESVSGCSSRFPNYRSSISNCNQKCEMSTTLVIENLQNEMGSQN